MSYVRSRKFCCCLPVRFGAIVIAVLGFLGGSFAVVAGIIQYRRTSGTKVSLLIQIIIYALLAVLSVLGLIGAIGKFRKLVSLYCTMLIAHLVFSIFSGAFALWRMFHDKQQAIEDCMDDSDSHLTKEVCEKSTAVIRGVMVGVFIVVWLIEIWGCVIVNDYSMQLLEEEDAVRRHKDLEYRQY